MLRALLIAIIAMASFSLFAEEKPDLPHYNPDTEIKLEGEVLSVQKYNFVNRPTTHVQFILRTDQGKQFTVDVGPEWYVETEGMSIGPHDEVKVEGSRFSINNHEVIIAREIEMEGYTLELRDKNGLPLWSGWRKD